MEQLKIQQSANAVIFSVKVVPRSSKTAVTGILGGMLKIKLAAAPEKGKANAAVARIIAKALGLDAREGRLAVHGWTQQLQTTALDVAARVKGWPLGAIVYTDIARDGMLGGANVEATAALAAATDVPVIASGGAWYEGRINLKEAIAMAAGNAKSVLTSERK